MSPPSHAHASRPYFGLSSLESTFRSLGGIAQVRGVGELGIPHSQVERAAAAARARGLWVPPGRVLTVEVSRGSHPPLRDPDDPDRPLESAREDVRILWSGGTRPLRDAFGIAPITDLLRQLVATEPVEYVVAVLDWLLRRSDTFRFDLERSAAGLSAAGRALIRLVDDRADSGSESVVRILLARAGCAATPQVRIPRTDLERMDLLVGDRLVIECDSDQHHGGRDQRLRDLRRDASLACLGFIVLRFDRQQIFFDPDAVVATVLKYVELGLHRF